MEPKYLHRKDISWKMSIKVKGLDAAIKALRKKGQEAEKAILDELESTATNIELTATDNVIRQFDPSEFNISGRIDKVFLNKGFTIKVGVNVGSLFDGWHEYGTGLDYLKRVAGDPRYTPEIQAQAKLFIGKIAPGTGRISGRPYFYPAYFQHTAQLVQRLKDKVSKAVK